MGAPIWVKNRPAPDEREHRQENGARARCEMGTPTRHTQEPMQHGCARRFSTGLAYGDRHQGILAEEFGKAPERHLRLAFGSKHDPLG